MLQREEWEVKKRDLGRIARPVAGGRSSRLESHIRGRARRRAAIALSILLRNQERLPASSQVLGSDLRLGDVHFNNCIVRALDLSRVKVSPWGEALLPHSARVYIIMSALIEQPEL